MKWHNRICPAYSWATWRDSALYNVWTLGHGRDPANVLCHLRFSGTSTLTCSTVLHSSVSVPDIEHVPDVTPAAAWSEQRLFPPRSAGSAAPAVHARGMVWADCSNSGAEHSHLEAASGAVRCIRYTHLPAIASFLPSWAVCCSKQNNSSSGDKIQHDAPAAPHCRLTNAG